MFEWVIFWFVVSILVGIVASSRGRDGFGWFMLSLFISPILSVLLLLCTSNLKALAIQKTQHEELVRILSAGAAPATVDATYTEVTKSTLAQTVTDNPNTAQGWLVVFGLMGGFVGFLWLVAAMVH